MGLEVGDALPDLELTGADGPIRLREYVGKPLVLYFYPKDDTAGCTREAQDFSAMAAEFAKAGAGVLGVSKDAPAKHAKFTAKYGLTVPLASDEKGVIEAFGAWVPKVLYGREYMGIDRSTWLFDASGKLAKVWRKVKVPGHVAQVLAAVKALGCRRWRRPPERSDRFSKPPTPPPRSSAPARWRATGGVAGSRTSSTARCPIVPHAPPSPNFSRPTACDGAARAGRSAGGSRCSMRSRISSSPQSISRSTWPAGSAVSSRAVLSTTGWRAAPTKRCTSRCSIAACGRSAAATARSRRMTAYGNRRRRPRTTRWRASRSCRWCSKRAGSTSRRRRSGGSPPLATPRPRASSTASCATKFVTSRMARNGSTVRARN